MLLVSVLNVRDTKPQNSRLLETRASDEDDSTKRNWKHTIQPLRGRLLRTGSHGKMHTSLECKYLPNAFFAILRTWLAWCYFITDKDLLLHTQTHITKLIAVQIRRMSHTYLLYIVIYSQYRKMFQVKAVDHYEIYNLFLNIFSFDKLCFKW